MAQPLEFTFKKIQSIQKPMLNKLAASAIIRIKQRLTAKGTDTDAKLLEGGGGPGKYSPAYARFRKKKKRSIAHINLQFTGKMVANIKPIRQSKNRVVIGFSSAEQQQKANDTTKRHGSWLGLTKVEQKSVAKLAEKIIIDSFKLTKKTFTIRT